MNILLEFWPMAVAAICFGHAFYWRCMASFYRRKLESICNHRRAVSLCPEPAKYAKHAKDTAAFASFRVIRGHPLVRRSLSEGGTNN